jgi:glycosyltransferase involved in cell wall biosynthesis
MSKNTFYVSCPIDTFSGYGSRSRDYVKALIELDKYDVKILPQRWGSTPFGFIDDHIEEWGFLKDHFYAQPQLTQQPDIWCQITVPNEFQKVGKYNIGLTAGIESTVSPHAFIEGCNRMDLILTSSNHSKKVFEDTKFTVDNKGQKHTLSLTTPVEVLIEGANLDMYCPKKSTFNLDEIKDSWCYLFVGHWMQGVLGEDRKNIGLLIKAFYEIFKDKSKPPALILKTSCASSSYMDRREILQRIDIIKKSIPSDNLPNIYVIHGELSDEEMSSLYNHDKVKAMVSLTKGEGFGRPLLEFSLTDKPVIATGWSGHIDFLKREFSALMSGKLTPIHPSATNDFLIGEALWFSVDHGNIGHFLTDVNKNYKDWKVKAKKQGKYSRANFSFDVMKKQLADTLERNVPEIAKTVALQLPKLNLPKLKKVDSPKPELPIKLPKLKKI